MMILMELETNKKPGPLAFVWPFFQTTRSHPSPQSVIVPITYPFLQICKFSSLSLFRIPPSAHLRNLKSLVLMVGLCDIDVPTDRPVYPHINEVYASKSGDELEVPKCRSVRLYHARTYDCEYERVEIPLCPCFSFIERQVLMTYFQTPSWSSTPRRMAKATVRNTGGRGLSMSKSRLPTRTTISTRLYIPSFACTRYMVI